MFSKLSLKLEYNPQHEMWYLKGYNAITAGEKTYFKSNHQKCTLLHPRVMSEYGTEEILF